MYICLHCHIVRLLRVLFDFLLPLIDVKAMQPDVCLFVCEQYNMKCAESVFVKSYRIVDTK